MKRYIVRKIGLHRGNPRVFLDIDAMGDAGFLPGKTYNRTIDEDGRKLTLSVEQNGTYGVCKKDREGKSPLPVIDINNSTDLKVFEGLLAVRIVLEKNKIHILPLASEMKRMERTKRLRENLGAGVMTTASLSFGAGIMDNAAHAGLHDAGIDATLTMANEIDEGMLNQAIEHNDVWSKDTIAIAAPMQELVQDDAAMQRLKKCDALIFGIPCSGASQAGKSKRKITMMESHSEVGHLIASAIMVINRLNPSVIVLENVVPYSETASAQILRQHLRDSGYDVQEKVLGASDFGSLENRVRWFLVAASRGINIDLEGLSPVVRPVKMISEVLEDIGPDAPDWRTFDYLKTKEIRDASKGNSFAMQVITPDSTSCPTIRKGYAKGGSTDPLLAHPTDPDLLRQLTVLEHGRIKNMPESLLNMACAMSKTDGHAMFGQAVCYEPVRALFKRIGQCLVEWKNGLATNQQQSIGYSLMRATG